ncbi:uncharacterized protein LOC117891586 [Drosophila subobscura]|uniref:uncharacterized protein LOC117891586 n=1 Tax=Drosophila subobscura TaxID=7241 RepID=UPI00155A512B|nr:uncharacterized protein LOC117891586 [Drosophila subobscura]
MLSTEALRAPLCVLVLLLTVLEPANTHVAFTSSSTHGIFAALAVPLEIPHRNVFVSYNFEANYNLPANWGKFTLFQNGPIESEELEVEAAPEGEEAEVESARKIKGDCQNCTSEQEAVEETATEQETAEETPTETPIHSSRQSRALITRSNIYRIFVDKLQRSGFQGEACLLRLICETSAAELNELNGVLGSLMHVLFSPSTSESEQLPLRYYQAEHDGWHDSCHHYHPDCGESVLELISEPFETILQRQHHM